MKGPTGGTRGSATGWDIRFKVSETPGGRKKWKVRSENPDGMREKAGSLGTTDCR